MPPPGMTVRGLLRGTRSRTWGWEVARSWTRALELFRANSVSSRGRSERSGGCGCATGCIRAGDSMSDSAS